MDEEQKQPGEPKPGISPAEVPADIQKEPQQVAQSTQRFIPKAGVEGAAVSGKREKFKAFLVECRRVLRVTKKPDKTEFATIVKISGIGMVIIGVIGFLIHFAKEAMF